MRALLVSALFVSLAGSTLSAQVQDDGAEALRIEALQDAGHENWKGRQHYLYDDEYQPETSGAAPSAKECTAETVRIKRSDGRTIVKRVSRCD
jgi:hypothetical protein